MSQSPSTFPDPSIYLAYLVGIKPAPESILLQEGLDPPRIVVSQSPLHLCLPCLSGRYQASTWIDSSPGRTWSSEDRSVPEPLHLPRPPTYLAYLVGIKPAPESILLQEGLDPPRIVMSQSPLHLPRPFVHGILGICPTVTDEHLRMLLLFLQQNYQLKTDCKFWWNQ